MKQIIIAFIIAHFAVGTLGAQTSSKSIRITGRFLHANPKDTVVLFVWNNYVLETSSMSDKVPFRKASVYADNGYFDISMDSITRPVYIYLGHGHTGGLTPYKPLLPLFTLAEPGDNINLVIDYPRVNEIRNSFEPDDNTNISFSGRGYEKYECIFRIQKKIAEITNHPDRPVGGEPKYIQKDSAAAFAWLKYHVWLEKCLADSQMVVLNNYKQKLPPEIFKIMYANLVGSTSLVPTNVILSVMIDEFKDRPTVWNKLKDYYFEVAKTLPELDFDDETLSRAQNYVRYLDVSIVRRNLAYNQLNGNDLREETYKEIKRKYSGKLRDQIMSFFFLVTLNNSQYTSYSENIEEAIGFVQTDEVKKMLLNLQKNQLYVGKKAFNFELGDANGKKFKMSDFEGKIVFIDFWYTGCTHCVEYYEQALKEVEEEYKNDKDVYFMTINVDDRKEQWLKSLAHGSPNKAYPGHYTSDLAINLYIGQKGLRHPLISYYNVMTYPHPLLFDQKGKLASADQLALRDADFLRKSILKLKGSSHDN